MSSKCGSQRVAGSSCRSSSPLCSIGNTYIPPLVDNTTICFQTSSVSSFCISPTCTLTTFHSELAREKTHVPRKDVVLPTAGNRPTQCRTRRSKPLPIPNAAEPEVAQIDKKAGHPRRRLWVKKASVRCTTRLPHLRPRDSRKGTGQPSRQRQPATSAQHRVGKKTNSQIFVHSWLHTFFCSLSVGPDVVGCHFFSHPLQ